MARREEHLARGAVLDDASPLHHRHLVADLRRDAQVVGDEQHGEAEARADFREQRQHLRLYRDIEGRHCLVGHQQIGLDGERARNADALALAAGKFVRVPVE